MANPFDTFDSNPFDEFDKAQADDQYLKNATINLAKGALGAVEAGAGMVAGLPSTIAGGLHGLGALAMGQGYEQAAKNVQNAQESNFGFGAFTPKTEKGIQYSEAVGGALAYPGEKVGDVLEKAVGPKTAFAGKLLTDLTMQFVDIGIPFVVAKRMAIRQLEKSSPKAGIDLNKLATPEPVKVPEDVNLNLYKQRALEQQQAALLEQQQRGNQPITVNSEGQASALGATGSLERQAPMERMASDLGAPKIESDVPPSAMGNMARDLQDHSSVAARAAQDALEARQRELEGGVTKQASLDLQAADRARQAQAPVGSPEMVAERTKVLEEQQRLAQEAELAKQDPALAAREEAIRKAEKESKGKTTAPETPVYELAPNGTLRIKEEATPAVELPKPSTMESAVDKVASERLFDMTAEERVVWEKTKAAVQKVDSGFTKLTDKQVLSKVQDRAWVEDAVNKIKQRRSMFDEIAKRSQDRQLVKEAQKKRELLTEQLQELENTLGPRPDVSSKQQGPKTLAARMNKQSGKVLFDFGKKKERDTLKNIPGVQKFIGEWKNDIRPFEQFKAEEAAAKDLDQNWLQRAANYGTKGVHYMALKTGNPLIKRVGDTMLTAANKAKADIAKIVHDKLSPASRELSNSDKAEVWAAQMIASQTKRPLTESLMRESGFNEKQIKWVNEHTEAMKMALERMNDAVKAGDMHPVTPEIAYLSSRASGDFRRLIYKEVNGEKVPVSILGADTRGRLNRDVKRLQELHPEWVVGEERYFGGGNRRATEGMKQVVELLSKDNPDVKLLAQHMNDLLTKDAMDYMGAKTHTMHKKGIEGMVGNKHFEDAVTNAKEGMQAQINYVEKMIEWSELSKATAELKPFLEAENGINMPKAKEWSKEYIQQALGNNPSEVGRSLDNVFAAIGKKSGIGSTNIGKIPRVAKQIVNGILLGGYNIGYLAMNMIEPAKSTPAVMQFLKGQGLEKTWDAGTGYKYLSDATVTMYKDLEGMEVKPYQKEALQYAKDNHVYSSDLFDSSNRAHKDFGHYADKAIRFGASGVEMRTRQMVYLAYVDLLHENGIHGTDLYVISQKLTDTQMGNYSRTEAPRAYAVLGGIGDSAYNLMSFKHNEYSRMALFAREIAKNKDAKPLLMALASSVAFAGIMGTTAYSEADSLVKYITSKTDKPTSLTKILLDHPEISDNLKYGMGAAIGLDMTSRLGTGPLIPQSITDAIMPGSGKLVNIAKAGAEAISHPSEYNAKVLAKEALPNSVGGILDRAWFSPETKQGELSMNKSTVAANAVRNTQDKIWKTLGMTGINEAKQKSREYELSNINKVFVSRRQNILTNAAKELFTSGKLPSDFGTKYVRAQGDPSTIEREVNQMALEQNIPAGQLAMLKEAASQSITSVHKLARRVGKE